MYTLILPLCRVGTYSPGFRAPIEQQVPINAAFEQDQVEQDDQIVVLDIWIGKLVARGLPQPIWINPEKWVSEWTVSVAIMGTNTLL